MGRENVGGEAGRRECKADASYGISVGAAGRRRSTAPPTLTSRLREGADQCTVVVGCVARLPQFTLPCRSSPTAIHGARGIEQERTHRICMRQRG